MKNFKSGTTGHIYIPSHAIIKNWQIFRRGKDKTKYHCICLKCGVEKEIPAEMLNDKKFEEKCDNHWRGYNDNDNSTDLAERF